MAVLIRMFRDHDDAGDPHYTVGMMLKRRVPKVLRIVLLTGEEAGIGRLIINREGKRKSNRDRRSVRALCLTLKIKHVEIAEPGRSKCLGVTSCALTLQHQHRQAFIPLQKIAQESAERERAWPVSLDQFRF